MGKTYSSIITFLQGLKGLSDSEAKAFLEICRSGSICVNDAHKILRKFKGKKSKGTSYNVMGILEEEGLVFQHNNSNKKTYGSSHPRELLVDLEQDYEAFKKEMVELIQEYEMSSDSESTDAPRTLDSIQEIRSFCYDKASKAFKISLIYNPKIKLHEYFKQIPNIKTKRSKSEINIILFENESIEEKGTIVLSPIQGKKGNLKIYGQLTYNIELFKYYKENE